MIHKVFGILAVCFLSVCSSIGTAVAGVNVTDLRLISPNPTAYGYFGRIAFYGDTLAVGANGENTNPPAPSSPVYLMRKDISGDWTVFQTLDSAHSRDLDGRLAMDGEWLMVCNMGTGTEVYVYRKITDGTYVPHQVIPDPSGGYGATTLTIDGDYALIGCSEEMVNGTSYAGAAYFFVFNSSSNLWEQQQRVTFPTTSMYNRFGYTLALEGNYAAIGKASDPGAVAVYYRIDTSWLRQQTLVPASPSAWGFGHSIDIRGTDILVGMIGPEPSGSGKYGAAFLYEKLDGVGLWEEAVVFTDIELTGLTYFGGTVTFGEGGRAYVACTNLSTIYVYRDDGSGWSFETKLISTHPESTTGDGAGTYLAVSGNEVIAGAPTHTANGIYSSGAVFIFTLEDILAGDIDGDGSVTLADAIVTLQVLTNGDAPDTIQKEASLNEEMIKLDDALSIMQEVLQTP